ncbi:MAG: MucR family transcriptional regulator [Alphaproteobacteria bacterium]|nr:MucR family transcriptional regulator [Alphaproteobacteria bacterium]
MQGEDASQETQPVTTLRRVTDIVTAYLARNQVGATDVPGLIKDVHAALSALPVAAVPVQTEALRPAVPVRKSVFADHLVCLEDGRKMKMLKRYLRSRYNMTPEQYRTRWNLPPDYPMVAPDYAQQRSEFAKKNGLGKTRKGR